MVSEFTYNALRSADLSKTLKEFGHVTISLSKKRAKLTLKLIRFLEELTGRDGREHSLFRSIWILTTYLSLLIRIMSFHGRLFQIFVFYFSNAAKATQEDSGGTLVKLHFISLEANPKQKLQ